MPQGAIRNHKYREKAAIADRGQVREKTGGGGLRFIVQKRDARQLHFDFRLELDGTLKSWAVTHGPSLDPAQKRLAVRTDDQPIEVTTSTDPVDGDVLWDAGSWHPLSDPKEALESGVLKFDLNGGQLKGSFVLMRLGKNTKAKRENWLLIKGQDRYARRGEAPVKAWTGKVASPPELQGAGITGTEPSSMRKTATLPAFIAPQLATLVTEAPAGANWFHEIKFDGYRAIATVAGGNARIYTRSGQDWTAKFQSVATAVSGLGVRSAVLDGEIVVLDKAGRSSFAELQHGLKAGEISLTYIVFDLLELDGRDLRREPLSHRKDMLRKLLKDAPETLRFSDHVQGHGDKMFAKACRMGLEGIVSKRADLPYEFRRSQGWLKVKCTGSDEFVVGGYRVSTKNGRPFASLLLGEFDGNKLLYRGRVGTGFDDRDLDAIGVRLEKLARPSSPFVDVPREIARDACWVQPRLVVQIAYTERTRDGLLRHPAFLGLRGDKAVREVKFQPALKTSKETSALKAPHRFSKNRKRR